MAVISKDYITATGQFRSADGLAPQHGTGPSLPGTTAGAGAVPAQPAGEPGRGLAAMEVLRARMPNEGGVQRGLAPSIDSAAFTGAATITIPFAASPARSFEPAISVEYNSHAGDGVFGLGFALNLLPVQRRTNRRTPRYDDTDSFQLGDVPLARLGQRDITRVVGGISYRVAAYARRAAATTVRTEHWASADDEPGFWRTINEAGVITVYGVTELARIADPADSKRVFAWLPQAQYDASGSAISYGYKQEDGEGVGDAVFERNRQRAANRYPRSIAYGNAARFLPASPLDLPPGPWHAEIVFDYGEYDFSPGNDDPYRPVRPWLARGLPFSDYSAGFEQRTHRLCRTMALFHRFDELGPAPVLAGTLSFSYDQAASGGLATYLVQAQSRGHRFIPSRPPGSRYWTADEPAAEFGYAAFDPASAQFEPLLTRVPGVPPVADLARAYCLADLDGSGVSGIVYADSASMLYWRPVVDPADPDGPVRFEPEQPVPVPAERQVSGQFRLGDVNGDGRMSLIVDTPGRAGFYGRTADGRWRPFTAFAGHVSDSPVRGGQPGPHRDAALPAQRAGPSGPSPAGQYARADLTGNGLPDLIRITYDAVSYAANLGEAGFAAFRRACQRPACPRSPPASGPGSASPTCSAAASNSC